jgi:demethylmenaquinone methyltransferase/2-methoxy-6-polyprenyl-1,4-benzoquinol methylase
MADSNQKKTTHFGFTDVPKEEKARMVGEVFTSVADKYDVMNDFMSFGVHRLWKKFAIARSRVRPGHKILDVAGGSGDLAAAYASKVEPTGEVILTDINAQMLEQGRAKLVDGGFGGSVKSVLMDAEKLCFEDNYFDRVSISFGLRNVTQKARALAEMARVIKPGGFALILEFSHPVSKTFSQLYELYSFKVIPKIGAMVARDADSYQYLVESIRKHPDQETLKKMMLDSGFDHVEYHNLTNGVVALHIGYKY